ncbi:TMEM175 family protein [Planococcus sp. APC 4015]|nr:TMEM175 family protein [Planococcus sp. APC 4015]
MSTSPPRRAPFSTARVEAYTDGVFAIAATLLVLDLTTRAIGEVGSDAEMWAALGGMWENFMAFVISFGLLSMLWVIHLQQFRGIERVDGGLLWLNNIRLLWIVLIPFTTSLVSEYSQYFAGRMLLPINFFFAALFGYLSWVWAASRGGHLLTEEAKGDIAEQSIGGLVATICGAVAALVSPLVGSWGFLAYVFNGPVTAVLVRRRARRVSAGADSPAASA